MNVPTGRHVPARYDILWHQGDTYTEDFKLTINGAALPLTGMTLAAQIKPATGDLIDLNVNITDTDEGEFTLTATGATLEPCAPGAAHYWELRDDAVDETILAGTWTTQTDRVGEPV
ncbi:MAG: hypothetical protein AAF567_24565 [Actinomycetota bacterium]